MSMKAKAAFVAASLALLVVLVGCGAGDDSSGNSAGGGNKQYTIGFVSFATSIPFFKDTTEGARQADAKLPNVKVEIANTSNGAEAEALIPLIQNMMTKGVDALVVPGIPQALPMLKRAAAEDIPIIFYSNGIPGSTLPKSTVNTDSVKGGELAGTFMKEQLHGQGSVAVIRYPKGTYAPIDARVEGFVQGLEGADIDITYFDVGCDSEAATVRAIQNALTRDQELDGVYGQCGAPALGAAQAIKQAQIDPSKVTIVGYDGLAAEIRAIIAGRQAATVAQFPVRMGSIAIETAYKVLQGKPVPENIDSGTLLITKENAAEELNRQH